MTPSTCSTAEYTAHHMLLTKNTTCHRFLISTPTIYTPLSSFLLHLLSIHYYLHPQLLPNNNMSQQQQPQRPQEPIKYGDVFNVSGELANQPIPPQDATLMQSTETTLLGQTLKGGPAAVMQSAATRNERAGVVGHHDVSDIADNQGMTAVETNLPGKRIITESVGGQVLGKVTEEVPSQTVRDPDVRAGVGNLRIDEKITIGEALEASALAAGDKPVDRSDAAAIQAAEVRATRSNVISPGGVAAMAQSAAMANARMARDEDKTKLADILTDAAEKLPADKPVTRQDAEGVMGAELRNNPNLATHPGGVAASVVAAARINQGNAQGNQ